MTINSLGGIVTPLVTPLRSETDIDHDSLRRLVDVQLNSGIGGLWVMGTTGEFAAFNEDERAEVVQTVVREVAGRVPVVANVSDAATRLVLRHTARAEAAGVDAVAVTPPYYYAHSQYELLVHYRAVAAATSLPVFIYNIPQTVRVAMALATAVELAEEGTAAGIKDSQNNLEWFRELTLALENSRPSFKPFAGTRHLIDAAVLAGAVGAIPSIANIHPELCVDTFAAAAAGDFARARESQTSIVRIEAQICSGRGSRNGAIIGMLKKCLKESGIISSAAITSPLSSD